MAIFSSRTILHYFFFLQPENGIRVRGPSRGLGDVYKGKVIDPSYAWIIPTGGNDKPVKIAFEGQTIVDEYTNYDRSREIQVYKKLGVVAMMTNNICVYEDTTL